jgi:hypothetical protein
MTGILVTAPPPILSQDRIKKFKILEATLRRIKAGRAFPKEVPCYDDWVPDKPAKGVKQWDDVHDKWKTPMWDDDNKASEKTMSDKDTASGDASKEMMSEKIGEEDTVSQSSDTKDFQTQFVQLWAKAFKWDETLSSIARLPKNMDRRFKEVFVAAPLMTK